MVVEDGTARGARSGATGLADLAAEVIAEYFQGLVAKHHAATLRGVIMAGVAPQDAEDAVQQAFMEAWVTLGDHGISAIAHPRTWLHRVAMRKHARPPGARRRVLTVPMPELPEMEPWGFDPADFSVVALSVFRCFQRLSDRQREVVSHSMDGLSIKEINQALGGADTIEACEEIKNTLRKARKLLREELRDHDMEGEGR